MVLPTTELYWVAGFLEGEGYFVATAKYRGNIQVGACQVQRQPLDRCAALLGGRFHRKTYKPPCQDQWAWTVPGVRAVGVMMMLYPLLSPKRQEQIRTALATWKTWGVANKNKTHCKRGHPLSGENLYLVPNVGRRECRTCREANWRRYEAVHMKGNGG